MCSFTFKNHDLLLHSCFAQINRLSNTTIQTNRSIKDSLLFSQFEGDSSPIILHYHAAATITSSSFALLSSTSPPPHSLSTCMVDRAFVVIVPRLWNALSPRHPLFSSFKYSLKTRLYSIIIFPPE